MYEPIYIIYVLYTTAMPSPSSSLVHRAHVGPALTYAIIRILLYIIVSTRRRIHFCSSGRRDIRRGYIIIILLLSSPLVYTLCYYDG
jgi:hypothetical protein